MGNPAKLLYSEQVMHIQQKHSGLNSERWQMAGDSFNVMQGVLIRSTLHHEVVSKSLSRGLFTKYFFNKSSDFGISFDGCTAILSIPWHDVIHCAQVLMFFGKSLDQSRSLRLVFRFKSDSEYAHHVFRQFASEYFGNSQV